MINADFHVHTTASDGRMAPEEILRHAVNAGLTHLAITDHDTVDGLLALEKKISPAQITVISGIEFSTDMPECEIHILGYGFDINHAGLRRQLDLLKHDRINRIHRMAQKLTTLGYPVEVSHILQIAREATAIGRPHVAKALVENGYFATVSEVFEALLNRDKPGYVPHYKLTPQEAIQLIHEAGGIAVLAHPGLVGDDKQVSMVIDSKVDGLEVFHPKHDAAAILLYSALAQQYGLLITGGSDFHGIPGRFPERLGQFLIPESAAKDLLYALKH